MTEQIITCVFCGEPYLSHAVEWAENAVPGVDEPLWENATLHQPCPVLNENNGMAIQVTRWYEHDGIKHLYDMCPQLPRPVPEPTSGTLRIFDQADLQLCHVCARWAAKSITSAYMTWVDELLANEMKEQK